MTYLEIIEWIENHLNSIEVLRGKTYMVRYADGFRTREAFGDELISIVLSINGKQLIK